MLGAIFFIRAAVRLLYILRTDTDIVDIVDG